MAYQDPVVRQVVDLLETQYELIKQEYHARAPNLPSDYRTDTEHHTLHSNEWKWHSFMEKGQLLDSFASKFSQTSSILQSLRDEELLLEGLPFGYAFFSTLSPNSTIAAHSSPMNLRLRLHLGLDIPSSDVDECGLQVASQKVVWIEGKAMCLDDSYVHQVWNHTQQPRVVLLVDIWHPDVSKQERADIIGMFDHARELGWWKAS